MWKTGVEIISKQRPVIPNIFTQQPHPLCKWDNNIILGKAGTSTLTVFFVVDKQVSGVDIFVVQTDHNYDETLPSTLVFILSFKLFFLSYNLNHTHIWTQSAVQLHQRTEVYKHRIDVIFTHLCVLGLWLSEAVRAGLCWLPSRAGLVM